MDSNPKNSILKRMKTYLYIALVLLTIACTPKNDPTMPNTTVPADRVYTTADFRTYGDYYKSGHQLYAIDLLSQGLTYDSTWHITGSGCNLYLSDVFAHLDSTARLPQGTYHMDSITAEMTFLKGMYFEGNVTGTYLLEIQDNQMQRITLFTSGMMTIAYEQQNILLDFTLYTADSVRYRATYTGPARYR
jgi:hypothetical protein